MKSLCSLLIILFATVQVIFSQQPEFFEEMAKRSDLIVEGEIISKRSYLPDSSTNIFTENIIKVNKVYKGKLVNENVIIITEGGAIGDRFHFLTHHLTLHKNSQGLFFLDQIPEKEGLYKLHFVDCGFLEIYRKKFRPYFSNYITAELPYQEVINQLLSIIR